MYHQTKALASNFIRINRTDQYNYKPNKKRILYKHRYFFALANLYKPEQFRNVPKLCKIRFNTLDGFELSGSTFLKIKLTILPRLKLINSSWSQNVLDLKTTNFKNQTYVSI